MAYLRDVMSVFTDAGVPVIQSRFPTGQKPPYAVSMRNGESAMASDDRPLSEYEIILYTRERDFELEFSIEDALGELGVPFRKGASNTDGETNLITIPFTDVMLYER